MKKVFLTLCTSVTLTSLALAADPADLLEFAKADPSALKAHKSTVTPVEGGGGIRVQYSADTGYPGVLIPAPAGGWNLSEYQGVEVELTNEASVARGISVRVDNKGSGEASNTEAAKIGAGQTKTIKVKFGQSFGNPGFQLDPAAVTAVQIFTNKPTEEGAFVIKELRAFKDGGTAATTSGAPATSGENQVSPSIGGELLDLTKADPLAGFRFFHSAGVVESGKVKTTFQTDTDYPSVNFPIPGGGWNLSAFGGVEVTVTNDGDIPVTAVLRVDNKGDWKNSPWNLETVKFAPGETKEMQVTFGQSNGKPGFNLDTTKVSAIQIFVNKPKQEIPLVISNLKAFGSPAAGAGKSTLTTPADRDKPVTPPDWLGQRPSVEGDWTLTFEDNFEGDSLDESKWLASNSHFSKFFF